MDSLGQTLLEDMKRITVKNLTTRSRFAKSTYRLAQSPKWLAAMALFLASWGWISPNFAAESNEKILDDVTLIESFVHSHAGYSTDEVLINEVLRSAFLTALRKRGIQISTEQQECDALLALLAIRKTGKLHVAATKRAKPAEDAYLPVAEIASRVVLDRHRVSSDTMLADPSLRQEFFNEAKKLSLMIDEYQVAKSVLRLRKIRQLKPELVLRVADWDRTLVTYSSNELGEKLASGQIPRLPGVYLFRDATGYLYIGEAENLEARLQQHLSGSDRLKLADYLKSHAASEISVEVHIFPKDSPAARLTVRRAYESELIRSREPKFNVRP